jgi:hypothetical protein
LRASGAIRGDGGDNLLFVEADLEEFILDSTDVRVHQHGAGARKKNGPQTVELSCGGLTTKVHAA